MKNHVIDHKNGNPIKNEINNLEVKTMTISELFGENSGIEFVPVSDEEREAIFKNMGKQTKSNSIREDEGKEIE